MLLSPINWIAEIWPFFKKYLVEVFTAGTAGALCYGDAFFDCKPIDDLLFHMHMNFKFFGITSIPSFACYDVLKNADIAKDLQRFEAI